MNAKEQLKEYEKLMGQEATRRQMELADHCSNCGAGPGVRHLPLCKSYPSKVKKRGGRG